VATAAHARRAGQVRDRRQASDVGRPSRVRRSHVHDVVTHTAGHLGQGTAVSNPSFPCMTTSSPLRFC